jgi:hypothetical protein
MESRSGCELDELTQRNAGCRPASVAERQILKENYTQAGSPRSGGRN